MEDIKSNNLLQLEQKIIHYKSELNKYKKTISEYLNEDQFQLLEKYKKEIARLQEKNEDYTRELENQYFEIQELLKEIAELKKENENRVIQYEKRIKDLNENIYERTEKMKVLERKLHQIETDNTHKQQTIEQLRSKNQDLEIQISDYSNGRDQITKENDELRRTIHELNQKKVASNDYITHVETKNKELTEFIEKLKTELLNLEQELKEERKVKNTLEKKYEEKIQNMVNDFSEKHHTYLTTISDLEAQVNQLLNDSCPMEYTIEKKSDYDPEKNGQENYNLLMINLKNTEVKLLESQDMVLSLEQKIKILTEEIDELRQQIVIFENMYE